MGEIKLQNSTLTADIVTRWAGLPVIVVPTEKKDNEIRIEGRLQKLFELSDEISRKWRGHSTLEEIRFQREKG